MFSALLYLQWHTLKNRFVMRVKRLQQPKYLLGAIVGVLYFYFYFYRSFFGLPTRRQALSGAASPADLLFYESVGALVLLMFILARWLVPRERAALAFTEAEVAFLFPAPISRRWLIHFKLARSQVAILFSVLFIVLVGRRFGGPAWIRAAGWWLIFSTLNLHLLGASFARTMLLDRGITAWQRRLAILALVLAAAGGVAIWVNRSLPEFAIPAFSDMGQVKDCLRQLLTAGPMPYLLYPFRLVVRPCLASSPLAFFSALAPALLLLVLHYWWVIRADVAFEEASVDASRKLADRIANARAGNWQVASGKFKGKRSPFTLRPTGLPSVALLWKNLISAGQAFSLRTWLVLILAGTFMALAIGSGAKGSNLSSVLAMISACLAVWSLFIGPQMLRQDFRQDLLLADVLKAYPLRGWQIALGEVLGPVMILTVIQWFLLLAAVVLFSQTRGSGLPVGMGLGIGLGAALLAPVLNCLTLLIPNLAVLWFPAWFYAGKESVQGIEATGQRIIFAVGQLAVLAIALVPAAAAFALVLFLAKPAVGLPAAIPLAALGAAAILAIEAALGLMLVGWVFERFDVAKELTD